MITIHHDMIVFRIYLLIILEYINAEYVIKV